MINYLVYSSLVYVSISFGLQGMESSSKHRVKVPSQGVRPKTEGVRVILSQQDVERITSFGDVVCQGYTIPLSEVEVLDLSGNNLTQLPQGFEQLEALKELSLRNNPLKELFPVEWRFPKLVVLDISHTKTGSKNIIWTRLYTLVRLIARDAGLNFFDRSICSLADTLVTADFSHNKLSSLEGLFFTLTHLTSLNLSHNQLEELSGMISKLALLKKLRLNDNRLKELPSQICKLPELEILILDNNQLVSLPAELGELAKLRILGLAGNQLTSLPDSMSQLAQLKKLFLSHNKLTSLAKQLVKLKQLETLTVKGNTITDLAEFLPELQLLTEFLADHA